LIDNNLNVGEQIGNMLEFIDNGTIGYAIEKTARVFPGKLANLWIFEIVIRFMRERLSGQGW